VGVELECTKIRENFWYLRLRNSSARVFYRNEKFAVLQLTLIIRILFCDDPGSYLYDAIMSKLAGVREEVHTNLLHPLLVSNYCLFGRDRLNYNVFAGRLHLNNAHNFG
jgi:hypothetical protein